VQFCTMCAVDSVNCTVVKDKMCTTIAGREERSSAMKSYGRPGRGVRIKIRI